MQDQDVIGNPSRKRTLAEVRSEINSSIDGVEKASSLADFHDTFKKRNRQVVRVEFGGKPYVKPDTGEPKGKKAIKFAKRLRSKIRKEMQKEGLPAA